MRLRGLHALRRLNSEQASATARQIVATHRVWTAFRVCDDWALSYGAGDDLAALIDVLTGRAEIFSGLLAPMYAEEVRRGRLMARRGMLRESRHRLFLALIVNLPDRGSIRQAIGQLFPDQDSSTLIGDLVEELASPALRGISGLSLSADELSQLKVRLGNDQPEQALGLVASQWQPPPLLESLFA